MGALAYMSDYKNKKIAVIGLGSTGRSCVKWLVSKGYEVKVFDTRESVAGVDAFRLEYPQVEVKFGALMLDDFSDIDMLVCSPGVSVKERVLQQLLNNDVELVGDIELFAREVKQPIIAITGSNGKSTVTTLVGEMARASGLDAVIAGNIGTPVLDLLADDPKELYVLELSSFQLETTYGLRPNVAVVLNISPDHMDRYDDLEEYAEAKARIYNDANICIINRDDPAVVAMVHGDNIVGFTLGEPASEKDFGLRNFEGNEWICKGKEKIMPVKELSLAGRHNVANALAALAICEAQKLDRLACVQVLKNFQGLPHRSQRVAVINGVQWINDSKGTNVGATMAAVAGMDGPVWLIAGGQSKDQDFSALAPVVAEKAKAVLLYGEDAGIIEQAIEGSAPIIRVQNLKEAVDVAYARAEEGDSVLLSPACASFDMFRNYVERGEVFIQLVEDLQHP
ncbi:MAG: UDP-N-acetylmuramoyl-L-alanine--D-glutamate ligase [Gammaproteobacteria bacterium]|nr:UDP-N-acetylmuramoyl-L-alanine--D-glutamate ligase [Gammaproteobacteria bacterium]